MSSIIRSNKLIVNLILSILKVEMDKVLDNLFISSLVEAKDEKLLEKNNIKHILVVADLPSANNFKVRLFIKLRV